MSKIDTVLARGYWEDETKYLKAIGFVRMKGKDVVLLADEEGNEEIILTPRSVKWLIKKLREALKR